MASDAAITYKDIAGLSSWKEAMRPASTLPIPLGNNSEGGMATLRLAELSALVVIGGDYAQHDELLEFALFGWLTCLPPEELEIFMFDCSGHLKVMNSFRDIKHVLYYSDRKSQPDGVSRDAWVDLVEKKFAVVEHDIVIRKSLLKITGTSSYEKYIEAHQKLPRRLVLICDDDTSENNRFRRRVAKLISQIDAPIGVHVVLLSTNGSGESNCMYKQYLASPRSGVRVGCLSFHWMDEDDSIDRFGGPEASTEGTCFYRSPQNEVVRLGGVGEIGGGIHARDELLVKHGRRDVPENEGVVTAMPKVEIQRVHKAMEIPIDAIKSSENAAKKSQMNSYNQSMTEIKKSLTSIDNMLEQFAHKEGVAYSRQSDDFGVVEEKGCYRDNLTAAVKKAVDKLVEEIRISGLPQAESGTLRLKRGETLHLLLSSTAMYETISSTNSDLRFVAFGELYLTNKRLVFVYGMQSRSIDYSEIELFDSEWLPVAGRMKIASSRRVRTVEFQLMETLTPSVVIYYYIRPHFFRTVSAIAHTQGSKEIGSQLRQELIGMATPGIEERVQRKAQEEETARQQKELQAQIASRKKVRTILFVVLLSLAVLFLLIGLSFK